MIIVRLIARYLFTNNYHPYGPLIGGLAMSEVEQAARLVFIISGTTNENALNQWTKELEQRGCEVMRISTVEECWRHMDRTGQAVSWLIDDVNPSTLPRAKELVTMVHNMRPEPVCVVLVSRTDFDEMGQLEDGRIIVHADGDSMDYCFDHLSGAAADQAFLNS